MPALGTLKYAGAFDGGGIDGELAAGCDGCADGDFVGVVVGTGGEDFVAAGAACRLVFDELGAGCSTTASDDVWVRFAHPARSNGVAAATASATRFDFDIHTPWLRPHEHNALWRQGYVGGSRVGWIWPRYR